MKIYRLNDPNSSISIAGKVVEFIDGVAEVEDSIGNILIGLKGYSASNNQSEKSVSSKLAEPEKTENSLEDGREKTEEKDDEEDKEETSKNLSDMSVDQLKKLAKASGIYKSGMTKQDMIDALSE